MKFVKVIHIISISHALSFHFVTLNFVMKNFVELASLTQLFFYLTLE